jgi:hypothetical protein
MGIGNELSMEPWRRWQKIQEKQQAEEACRRNRELLLAFISSAAVDRRIEENRGGPLMFHRSGSENQIFSSS